MVENALTWPLHQVPQIRDFVEKLLSVQKQLGAEILIAYWTVRLEGWLRDLLLSQRLREAV